ncbi:tetratricopeptide repeat protein (macronuclear) [Tetrahymena thermophila SB210]|uniref:Tetratricopeptide repeat protein n=1 Tax=Tetrahymena thermophila (strain SB210) TaxID=312017 RepID=Q234Z7_TETTS|nr:tetratricopeptide repeat protein [Tetrahymena thermophila SB210]EAR91856.1 tetratricopeptide repeat protein [Tetrahymena thermophila SB210]|eukprot:XP_001012101.1 tetratricopeptide repeat protein [Tetrahymena thermophila SB210]
MSDSEQDSKDETLEFLAQQLEQHYHLKTINKFGGQGGFGLVLFVQDENDESQKYAVKAQSIINTTTGNINQVVLKQCKEEARVMKECKHQNVVEIYSDFVLGFYHFILMRLCKQSLNDWIVQNGKNSISDQVFCKFAEQMIEGLEYLHNRDYVLRDVSVRNILLTANDEIKFCDFGLARKYDSSLRSKVLYTSHLNGVIYYFPPEIHQAIQENKPQIKQTKEGDIWALGVCLSLLGGIPIVHFSNSFHEDFKIIDAPNLSKKANQLIKQILIKDAKKRPSFKEIKEHIQNIFQNEFEIENKQEINLNSEEKTINQFRQQEKIKDNSQKRDNLQETDVFFVNRSILENKIMESSLNEQSQLASEADINIEFNFLEGEKLFLKYKEKLNQQPENIEILLLFGHIEIKMNCNFEFGQNYLNKVISLKKDNLDAYLGICESFLLQKNCLNYSQIEEYIKLCFNINPSYWRLLYIQAWLLYEQENYIESEKIIIKALLQFPHSPLLNSLHALILVQKNFQNKNTSEEEIKKSIESNPLNDPIVLSRAGFFYQYYIKQLNKAQEFYIKALSLCPQELLSLSNLVLLFNEVKENTQLKYYKKQIKSFYSENSFAKQILGRINQSQEKKIKYFQKSTDLDPYMTSSYFYLSEVRKQQLKFSEVEEIQKLILEINPKAASACIELANIYLHKSDRKSAQQYLFQAQQLENKQECDSLYLDGINFELDGYDELALKQYYQSINKNPIQERSYQRIIRILQLSKQQNFDELINVAKKALIYNPVNELFKLVLIEAHIEKQQYIEAKAELMDLLIINPKRREVYEKLAYLENVYFKNKDQAILYYLKELEINQSETSMVHLVNIYLEKNQYQLAEEHLNKYLQIFPNNKELKFSKAVLLKSKNSIDEAIQILKEILLTNQSDFKIYNELGYIYQTYKQDYNESLIYYNRSLEINNQVTSIYYNIALIYLYFKNYDYAEKLLKDYIKYFSNDYKGYFDLGQIYYIKNELPIAASYFLRTIQMEPNHEQAYYLLSQIQIRENKYADAIVSLKKVRELNLKRYDALLDLANLYSIENPQLSSDLFFQFLQHEPLNKEALKAYNQITNGQFLKNLQKELDKIQDEQQKVIMLKQIVLLSSKPTFQILKLLASIQIQLELIQDANLTINLMQKHYPREGYSYLLLAEIQVMHLKNYKLALEQLNKAKEYQVNEEGLLYLYTGFSYWKLKDLQKAIKFFKKSAKSQPLAYFYLAEIEMNEKQDYLQAIQYLQQCLKQNFTLPKVYFALGQSYQKLNYIYQAKESYEKVLMLDPNYFEAEKLREFINQNPNPEKQEFKEKCSIF